MKDEGYVIAVDTSEWWRRWIAKLERERRRVMAPWDRSSSHWSYSVHTNARANARRRRQIERGMLRPNM